MRGLYLLVLTLFVASAATMPAGAVEPRIVEVQASLEEGQVLVDFRLEGAFGPRLRERVGSGLPTELTYEIELLRDRKRWFDRGLEQASLRVVTMYNALTDEYLLNFELDGKLVESRLLHEASAVEPAMTAISRLPVFALGPGELEAGRRRLLVRVRAVLGTRALLGFIPSRDETPWVESTKFRPRSGE